MAFARNTIDAINFPYVWRSFQVWPSKDHIFEYIERFLMRKQILILVLFPLISQAAIKPDRYPKVHEVIKTFFENYSRSEYENDFYVSFEKRPNGYWVVEKTYEGDSGNRELLWSYKKRKYMKLSYPANSKGIDKPAFQEAVLRARDYEFKSNIFYGYVGWQQDVIKHFEKKGKLSDEVLYALGRTYSCKASDLLHNNSGLSDPEEWLKPDLKPNSLSSAELAKYRKFRHIGLDYFKTLQRQNPNFKVLVGSIGVKTAHEHVTAFLDLLMFQNEVEALKELKPNIYTQLQINLAKNYLQSCDENAILFVNGDGDTYPLYYVQAMEGFRTDVTVVNLSLLNAHRYIYWLRNPRFKNVAGLEFTPNDEHLTNEQRRTFYVEEGKDTLPLEQLLKETIKPENVKQQNGITYYSVTGGYYQFGNQATFKPPGQYIHLGPMMVYDIVHRNFGNRPIYFASTIGTDACAGLENFSQLEGFALRLSDLHKIDEQGIGYIGNASLLYKRLMHQLDWSGLETMELHNERQAMNNRQFFVRLARHYMLQNELDSARLVIAKCMDAIPPERVSCGYWGGTMVPILYEFDMDQDARDVAISTINGHMRMIEQYKEEGLDYTLHFTRQANKIVEIVEDEGQTELAEKLKEIINR